jgi:putative MFS transporter
MTSFLHQSDKLSRSQLNAWTSAVVGWIFDYYEVFLMTFLVVPISKSFNLSSQQTSYIISLQLLFLAVGGVLFGLLADRYGRRRILMATILIYAAFTLVRAFSPNYTVLLALTAVAATGLGGEYGVGQTLVSEVMSPRRRGWWSGLLYGGIYIGIIAGALVGGYVAPVIGWRWTFVLSAFPAFLALLIRYATPESDVWSARRKTSGTNWKLLRSKKFATPFFLCLIAGVFQFFAYYGVTTFLPTYLVNSQGFSLPQASWWLFFTAIAGLIGSVVGAYTNDRWGRRVTLSYIAGSAAAGGFALYALTTTTHGLSTNWWIFVPFFFLYFGSNGATVFGALFSEQFPTEIRSTGVSWTLQIARGLSFFPPLVAAAILPVYGFSPVVLGGAILFGLLALWAWVFRETRGMEIEGPTEKSGSEQVGHAS